MMPKKPAPHVMRGGYRFSENIMLQQETSMMPKKPAPHVMRGG
jgi:hypothetical protein